MMTDTYDKVRATSILAARCEQAQLVLDIESTYFSISRRLLPTRGWHLSAFPTW
jgi:hypothetical protein